MKTKLLSAAILTLAAQSQAFDLTLIHINDHHSNLEPSTLDIQLDGEATRVEVGGFPRITNAIAQLRETRPNPVALHAGDAITGDLYYTLFRGEADAALMNTVCFDAFALGNHEFDDGDAGLADFLNDLNGGACQTPVLAANVVPAVGTPLRPTASNSLIQPYHIVERSGERIGIVGIDIKNKTQNSSSPLESTEFLDETRTAQRYIDQLTAEGVDKIVLLTHYQYQNDLKLAQSLRNVDVIIGGDSHTLLGDFSDIGLDSAGPYPTRLTNASGQPVCVAQAWQYSTVVGELSVRFDDRGVVESCDGTPHLLMGNSFLRRDDNGDRKELTGSARLQALAAVQDNANLLQVGPDAQAQALLEEYKAQVDVMSQEQIGVAQKNLCLERIPGQGYSKLCAAGETVSRGSDISNIVAKAFREQARTADIAIQNGGGVRIDIPQGPITIGDAYRLLPFSNTIVELEMTGAEIAQVLEDAYAYATSENGSTGAFPYASGLRWTLDTTAPQGQRFINLEVRALNENQWRPLPANETFTVVTNDYIAGGKDGYVTFGEIAESRGYVNTYLDYAQSFVDYVKRQRTLDRLPAGEYSTQRIIK
ncbi:NAD nucleotidase [Salinibius halmophilus]|uniref:NAD nucleotidase n=1 Tax=Salinibius halmophilus TaxID=1853216 RepID=UPI001F1C87CC|nr:NAD nucleotidase [Salinibius halmophilus]